MRLPDETDRHAHGKLQVRRLLVLLFPIGLKVGDDDFRSDNTRSNLSGARKRGSLARALLKEFESLSRYRERSEAFGDNESDAKLLVAGNGDSQIVAEQLAYIAIVDASSYQGRDSEFTSAALAWRPTTSAFPL